MKKAFRRVLCLVLVLILTLTGCTFKTPSGYLYDFIQTILEAYTGHSSADYADISYVRPDMADLQQTLDETCTLAATCEDIDTLMEGIYAVYDAYDWFYTNYNLANIYYCADMTDAYWEKEYTFCLEQVDTAEQALTTLYKALAASALRETLDTEDYFGEGFLSLYEDSAGQNGGAAAWSDAYIALLEEENRLLSQYYTISAKATEQTSSQALSGSYAEELESVFLELVMVRQQIAATLGYDNYSQYAYENLYGRQYTPEEAEAYLLQIQAELSDIYDRLSDSDVWELGWRYCSENATFRYLQTVTQNMGGVFQEAFSFMESQGVYDIAYHPNKYPGSFEVYLTSYQTPFLFLSPYTDQTDKLSFAHEFGHFCSDYICYGSYAGMDILEVQSQAMEYLSVCYGTNTEPIQTYKLADSLSTYVGQTIYSLFELQVYRLEGDALTTEAIRELYLQTEAAFGFEVEANAYVSVPHFFTDPFYLISYIVSNDLALQIYQMELEDPGAGLALYQACLESQDESIEVFAQNYGLESPFAPGRIGYVAALFREQLQAYL